jgi:hypothetical protein
MWPQIPEQKFLFSKICFWSPLNCPKNEFFEILAKIENLQKSRFGKMELTGPKINKKLPQLHFSQP